MKKRVIIIGAGEAGKMVVNDILNNSKLKEKYDLIGFLDDDPSKDIVLHTPVIGKIDDIKDIVNKYNIDEIIIAIPSAKQDLISRIIQKTYGLDCVIKIVPGIYEIIKGDVKWNQVREIKPEDLLGREEVGFEIERISPYFKNKKILVTGAGGSIGSEIVKHFLKLPVSEVYGLGHGENSIYNLIEEFREDKRFKYIIGDIRDKDKIDFIINKYNPHIVIHAAAHKHLPLMEDFPDESIKNNIIGTYNVLSASINNSVSKFLLISTDKAVNPTSVMGASKRVAEIITYSFNKIQDKTKCFIVRFGNVLGSRGSVLHTFKKQIEKGGPVTITHRDIERFFMSIPEAARLVIKSLIIEEENLFVLDMGRAIRIIDLAKNLIRLYGYSEKDIEIKTVGLRKGEKLYEELTIDKNSLTQSYFDKILISKENFYYLSKDEIENLIKESYEISKIYDSDIIKSFFKKYVKEYQPNS